MAVSTRWARRDAHPAGSEPTARWKRTAQAPGRPFFLLGQSAPGVIGQNPDDRDGDIDRDPYLAAWTCTGEVQEWGNAYIRAVGREGLEPGASTRQFTLQSGLGYTGEQARLEMLQHRDFVDAKVELFVKQGAGQWVKLGEHQIEKQLLTQ